MLFLEISPPGLNKMSSFFATSSNHINLVQSQRPFPDGQGPSEWQGGLCVMNKTARSKMLLVWWGTFLEGPHHGEASLNKVIIHGVNMRGFRWR